MSPFRAFSGPSSRLSLPGPSRAAVARRAARRQAMRLAAVAILGLGALGQKSTHGVGDDDVSKESSEHSGAVLLIDGEPVPAEAYANWLVAEVGPPLVQEFAGGWLVERTAQSRGLAPSDAAIGTALESELDVRIQNAFLGNKSDWLAELRRLGRSESGHRQQRTSELRTLLATTALAAQDRRVPEEKITRDWELFYGPRGRAFDLDMLKFRVVVELSADMKGREEYERARENARSLGLERAEAARARILAGEDIAELARTLSDDEATKENGGRVERFVQFGWPTGFVDALFQLHKGDVSEPLFARGGWWILHVRDWHDTPLESVRAQLVERLVAKGPEQDEIGAAWNAVTKDMQVEILPTLYETPRAADGESTPALGMLVNGQPVPRAEYARWLLHTRGEASWSQFTEEWLVEKRAGESGVQVSEAEVEARVKENLERSIAEGYKGNRETWLTYLKMTGRDEDSFMRQSRRRTRLNLLIEKLILAERKVTDADVRARFEQLYGATGRRVDAKVILLEIPTPDMPKGLSREEMQVRLDEASEARRRDALAIEDRLNKGEDFGSLAQRYSDDRTTRELRGVLTGGFDPQGWSTDVSSVVMAMDRGQVSAPMLEGRWWAIFEVTDFTPVPYDTVKDELRRSLVDARPSTPELAAYRNVLLQQSDVTVLQGIWR